MKTKLRFFGLLFTVCLVLCCVFAGCKSAADYEAIYNDDIKIAASSSSTSIGSVQTSTRASYKLSCTSFSGVKIIKDDFYLNRDTTANLSLKVDEGKFKVVFVKNENVYTLTEGGHEGELDLSDIPDGKYKVKIVGVNAKINLYFTYVLGIDGLN